MTFMAEPAAHDRVRWGLYALVLLSVLIALSYALKKAFWRDVH
jgi:ubiquinol-cytochrome c reductase cytochrome c1 subunit